MSLITGLLKKNFLFYLLQIIIFTVCFVFVDLCTFLGLQMYSIIGIFLIFGAFIYSVIVITSLFKNQIIIDRDNWNSLSRLDIYPGGELVFYLPSEEYLSFGDDEVMRYLFNTKNGENIDERLGNISFESKQQWINRYENERKMIRSGGTFFAFSTVVIGFITFLNIIMISYIDRKKEFEVLEHIGMSTMQMRRMILAEGLGYGIVISFISLSISRLIVLFGKLLLTGKSWRYCYTMEPVCYCCIFVLFFTLTVPLLVYKRCR